MEMGDLLLQEQLLFGGWMVCLCVYLYLVFNDFLIFNVACYLPVHTLVHKDKD